MSGIVFNEHLSIWKYMSNYTYTYKYSYTYILTFTTALYGNI